MFIEFSTAMDRLTASEAYRFNSISKSFVFSNKLDMGITLIKPSSATYYKIVQSFKIENKIRALKES